MTGILNDTQPDQFYTLIPAAGDVLLGTGCRGVVRSADGGRTWRTLAPQLAGLVESIAASVDTEQGPILLAGGGAGVLRSTDDGASWVTTLTGSPIYALVLAADQAGSLVALAGTAGDGIFRSQDGGGHWVSANAGLFDLEVLALAFSPAFAADNTVIAGTVGGIYRSRNGGQAWRPLETPAGDSAVQCVAVSPAFRATGVVLAGTEERGMLRSLDGGETWATVTDLDTLGVAAITWSQTEPALVIASTALGMARSDDSGATWRIVANPGPALSLAMINPTAGELMVGALAGGGLTVSTDQGESWREQAVSVE